MKTPKPETLTYAEHASDIVACAVRCIDDGRPFSLITSLAIEGGAARDVGSLAIVDDTGAMTGYLSNGCIDRDIQHHATEALLSESKTLIRYGEGSRYGDLKLPCGGALTVLIDPAPDKGAILNAAKEFGARRPVTMTFGAGLDESGVDMTRHFTYAPKVRLMLAGRGAIFRTVAQVGEATGFDIRLMSPDTEDLAAIGHLASAPAVHLTSPTAASTLDALDGHSAFLTLFHDHDWEPALLSAALETQAGYIGSLGSMRTHQLRTEALRQMGVAEAQLQRLNGPIGLVPSLRDASFIAVSAIAEIVAAFPSAIQIFDSE